MEMLMLMLMVIKLEWAVLASPRLGEGRVGVGVSVSVGDCDFAGRQPGKATVGDR